MGLSDELWAGVESIWETVVTHSSVTEMADGFLDRERFHVYFDEDYPFLRDWAIPLSLATAKAPDSGAARGLVRFLHLGLGGEEGLFQEAFRKRESPVKQLRGSNTCALPRITTGICVLWPTRALSRRSWPPCWRVNGPT